MNNETLAATARALQDGLVPWLGLALLTLGGWLAYTDHVSAAATCFTVGILVLLVANIDRVESFKGFGIEAKTRDLKQAISEAQRSKDDLEQLRQEVAALSEELNSKLAGATLQIEQLEKKTKFAHVAAAIFAAQNFGGL